MIVPMSRRCRLRLPIGSSRNFIEDSITTLAPERRSQRRLKCDRRVRGSAAEGRSIRMNLEMVQINKEGRCWVGEPFAAEAENIWKMRRRRELAILK